jgi:hypothetical protein
MKTFKSLVLPPVMIVVGLMLVRWQIFHPGILATITEEIPKYGLGSYLWIFWVWGAASGGLLAVAFRRWPIRLRDYFWARFPSLEPTFNLAVTRNLLFLKIVDKNQDSSYI